MIRSLVELAAVAIVVVGMLVSCTNPQETAASSPSDFKFIVNVPKDSYSGNIYRFYDAEQHNYCYFANIHHYGATMSCVREYHP